MFLATKTILYVGFSLKDDDFLRIHDFLSKEMKGLRPPSYIVTLDRSSHARFQEIGVSPIYTDGTFFLTELKKRLTPDGHMIADERFDGLFPFYKTVLREHKKVSAMELCEHPDVIYCLAYQDGLKHALGRIVTLQSTGYYSHSCNVNRTMVTYEKIRKPKLREKRYSDVAYVDGYINGHFYLVTSDDGRRACPIYYVFGCDKELSTYAEFRKALSKAPNLNRRAHALTRKTVIQIKPATGIQLHHPPIL